MTIKFIWLDLTWTVHLDSYVVFSSLASHQPFTLCQFSLPFSRISSLQTTFMTKHGLIPSKWCFSIPQQKTLRYFCDTIGMEVKKKTSVLFLWFFGTESWRRWAVRWEKPDIQSRSVRKRVLVWSEATGTGLHSQVPEQNPSNLSGLKRTQNCRLQTSVLVCRRLWVPAKPHICLCHEDRKYLKPSYLYRMILLDNPNTTQRALHHLDKEKKMSQHWG